MKIKSIILIAILCLFISCGKSETELTGEIFITTNNRDNVKLGAVEILLISEKDIKPFIESKKNDSEIEQAKSDYETAKQKASETYARLEKIGKKYEGQKASLEQIKQSDNLSDLSKGFDVLNEMKWSAGDYDSTKIQSDKDIASATEKLEKLQQLASAEKYFISLPTAVSKTISNSDGKFNFKITEKGRYAVVAKTERMVGTTTESYYWMVLVDADGKPKITLLSNNNLTSSDSPESLVKTIEYKL